MGALARRMGGSPKLSFSKTARRNLRSWMRLSSHPLAKWKAAGKALQLHFGLHRRPHLASLYDNFIYPPQQLACCIWLLSPSLFFALWLNWTGGACPTLGCTLHTVHWVLYTMCTVHCAQHVTLKCNQVHCTVDTFAGIMQCAAQCVKHLMKFRVDLCGKWNLAAEVSSRC